jgi:hypothetical protein
VRANQSILIVFYTDLGANFRLNWRKIGEKSDKIFEPKKATRKWLTLKEFLVGLSRLELLTPTMSRWCSNQLSYSPATSARGEWADRARTLSSCSAPDKPLGKKTCCIKHL